MHDLGSIQTPIVHLDNMDKSSLTGTAAILLNRKDKVTEPVQNGGRYLLFLAKNIHNNGDERFHVISRFRMT